MGEKEPESQSLSLQVRETARWAGSRQCLVRKDLRSQVGSRTDRVLHPAGQGLQRPMPRDITVVWNSTLGCGAWLSQQWSGPASVIPSKWWTPPFWVFSINVLTLLMASGESPQEPICRSSCSADVATLTKCADILGASSCQTGLIGPC